MVLIATLALAVFPTQTNASFFQHDESSINEFKEQITSAIVLVSINQAVNFNHVKQTSIDYILAMLLLIFLIYVVNYRWFKPTISPPPWYIILRYKSRMYIPGLTISNLQYKAELNTLP
jgi:hypothetical protein